jgi:endonuclease/exonuclease/phosphatase family metal-dependent hydrolase
MQPIRILSYNVRYFGHATRGLASTKQAMHRIAQAIAMLDPLPAIVCLQEVETRSLRSTVAHRGEETQLERFMAMLSAALAEVGRVDAYEAYYFPAHAYRLSAPTATSWSIITTPKLRTTSRIAVRTSSGASNRLESAPTRASDTKRSAARVRSISSTPI